MLCLALGVLARGSSADAAATNLWFPVGEKLTYTVAWGFINVAECCITSEWINEDGRDLIAIRLRNRSNSFLDKIFPVDDFMESVVDPATFVPLRFTKKLSEGRYRLHEVTTFDHQNKTAHWKHLLKDKQSDFAIDSDTRDLLSFMYFMRAQKFQMNSNYQFRVMADEKLYELLVTPAGIETFDIDGFGDVRSMKVDPEAKFQGLFVRVGRLQAWISDDARYLCTKAMAKTPFGSVKLYIHKVEGPGDDFWTHPGDTNYLQSTSYVWTTTSPSTAVALAASDLPTQDQAGAVVTGGLTGTQSESGAVAIKEKEE